MPDKQKNKLMIYLVIQNILII